MRRVGSKLDSSMDAIVCLDACFTQKRRKAQGNLGCLHDNILKQCLFLLIEAEKMEALVEEVRPSKPKPTVNNRMPSAKPASTSGDTSDNVTDYEPGLRVPTSVLDDAVNHF